MNILPFVFTILMILSYGTVAYFQNYITSNQSQTAYTVFRKLERNILKQSNRSQYKNLPGVKIKKTIAKTSTPKKEAMPEPLLTINPPCARLNLFPLISEGKDEHPGLYQITIKLIRLFYEKELFSNAKGTEYRILDSLILSAKEQLKEQPSLPLETIALSDKSLQRLYYTMLKGTRRCVLEKIGHPSLIDYVKIEKNPSQICLFDAHPHLLTLFFGTKTATLLFEKLHKDPKATFSENAILELSNDSQLHFMDPSIWALLDFKRHKHGNSAMQTFVAEDSGSILRKDIVLR